MNRIIAIGDIHGHLTKLKELLEILVKEIDFDLDEDHLVLLGDLVDYGPETKDLIEFCIETQRLFPNTFHPLRGNHDDMLVDVLLHDCKRYGDYYLWAKQGGHQTIMSYMPEGRSDYDQALTNPLDIIPKEHLDFLDSLPFYWETDKYFFVHGGLPAPLSEIDSLDYPATQYELLWIRSNFYNNRADFGKKVIFGHTPFTDHTNIYSEEEKYVPYVEENMIGINTLPRHKGYLTAVELPSEKFYFGKEI
jgi:serine/threonine protein phosphatase 1